MDVLRNGGRSIKVKNCSKARAESKAGFIAQVMNGDATVRRAEDVDAATLTYAEVIHLSRLKKQHLDSQYQLRYRMKSFAESAEICRREIAQIGETKTCKRLRCRPQFVRNMQFSSDETALVASAQHANAIPSNVFLRESSPVREKLPRLP